MSKPETNPLAMNKEQLYRFIKASERLPEDGRLRFALLQGKEKYVGNFHKDEDGVSWFTHITFDGARSHLIRGKNIEWLDKVQQYAIDKYGFSKRAAKQYRNCGGWDDYFEEGSSPENAVDEDVSYSAEN